MKIGFLKAISIATVAGLLLTACSGASPDSKSPKNSSETTSESNKEADSGENVTLKLYANYSDDQEINKDNCKTLGKLMPHQAIYLIFSSLTEWILRY